MNEKEIKNKMKQFIRILISYNDMQNAHEVAHVLVKDDYQEQHKKHRGQERGRIKMIWESLSCTMVISYCRPFSGNDKPNPEPIPDLSNNILKVLTPKEKELHSYLLQLRNKSIAHSDSDAVEMLPHYTKINGKVMDFLMPLRNDTTAPFLTEVVKDIEKMSSKLLEEIFRRRMLLEEELKPYFPVIDSKTGEYEFPLLQE